jgi:hypothetical protein
MPLIQHRSLVVLVPISPPHGKRLVPFFKLEFQLKLMMNEITELEKNLSYGLSFEALIGHLSAQLADYIDEDDSKTFSALTDTWVLDMPEDALDLELLTNVHFKYLRRTDPNVDIPSEYLYLFRASWVYAAAAQRAHNRKEIDLAWAFLLKAKQEFYLFDAINQPLLANKLKFDKSMQAAANGGMTGQRVRYRITMLLYKKFFDVYRFGFPDLETAIHSIHADMAEHIKRTGLKISLDDLVQTVKGWLKEHPAFRQELEELFVDDEIKY